MKFFNAVDDCIAQCAASFGGGLSDWREMTLSELIRWTHKAWQLNQSESE